MAIRFKCTNPSCGRPIEAPDSAGGKKARCPKCGIVLSIPAACDLFPAVDDVPRPPAAAPRATAAPRMLAGSPPKPQKPPNTRMFVIAGIALLAITVVVVVILMATKTDSPKPVSPVAAPELPAAEEPSKPQPPVVAVAPAAPAKTPPAAVPAATTAPAAGSTPIAKVTPISTAPSTPPTGTHQGEGTAVVTPGGTLTVINTPTEYAGALLGARALGQRAKSLENMKLVRDALTAYTMEADKFPANWAELTSKGGLNGDAIKSPGDPKKNFVLVSGQSPNSTKTNILAYDPFPYRRTDVVIIEVDGSPKFISIDDLKKRLTAQGAKPNEIPD